MITDWHPVECTGVTRVEC